MKWVAAFAVAVLVAETAFSATVILSASKDNTLFESATGMESNGAGDSFFAGRTGVNDGGAHSPGDDRFRCGIGDSFKRDGDGGETHPIPRAGCRLVVR